LKDGIWIVFNVSRGDSRRGELDFPFMRKTNELTCGLIESNVSNLFHFIWGSDFLSGLLFLFERVDALLLFGACCRAF